MAASSAPISTWVALLRGINVGGRKRVAMADLRSLVASLGYGDVVTYIQSGNVVFDTSHSEALIVAGLEERIANDFGLEVAVIVRSAAEMVASAATHPLAGFATEPGRLMVAFLDRIPAPLERVVDSEAYLPDRFTSAGRDVYLCYPNGSARSKLTNALLEAKLGVRATVRNWNTVAKLAELAGR